MESFNINRRQFLHTASASMAISTLGMPGIDLINPTQPYKVGLIGTGWYGKSDLFRLIQVVPVDVVAICDVDKNILDAAGKMISERQSSRKVPQLYGDYRKMLADHKFDIVLIGTPDHWHALNMIDAVKAGAHVYVQKPISVDVIEGEAMVAAARKFNKIVQVGVQRRSTPHLIDAKKHVIEAGLLGKISHAEICCYYSMRNNTNPPLEPIPAHFDYEMWTGPAPMRPFDGLPHVRWWRTFMQYGNGIVGDMCVHMLDTVRWLLNLGWPTRITSSGGIYQYKTAKSNISDTQTANFEFPELNVVWTHRSWGTPNNTDYPWSFTLYGEKGTLWGSTMRADFIPISKDVQPIHFDVLFEKEQYPEDNTEPRIELNAAPATRRQMLDFLHAIENKHLPVADIEQGHISSASCILANMAMESGKSLVYDPKQKIVVGDKLSTKKLAREYRKPWIHPTIKNI